jgi:hypothetical protein
MDDTVFRKPKKNKQPINEDTDKFNIIFNPVYKNKDSIGFSLNNEKIHKSYIKAIIPQIRENIQISNVIFADKIDDELTEEDIFDIAGIQIMSNVEDTPKEFCTNLDNEYIKYSLKNCNAIITLQREKDEIISFASLYFDPPNILYIDVICSSQLYSGGGKAILEKIKELCKIIDIDEIKLSSVTESLDFYTKKNEFVCDELCNLKLQIPKNEGKYKKGGKWSMKYKKSINCRRPKGFSQKQHCKYGRKTRKNKVKKET